MEQELIIKKIIRTNQTTLYPANPYRSKIPRTYFAAALVHDGVMLYQNDDGVFRVTPGEVIVVTPCEHDSCTAEGESVTYDTIDFFADESFTLSENGIARINRFENTQTIFDLFNKIRFAYESRQPHYRLRCMELLYAIFNQIAFEKHKHTAEYRQYRRIVPAILQIEREFHKPLTCKELADLCGLSVSSLNRLFAAAIGSTPMQYLHHTRMEYAKDELTRRSVNIGELAERCGYSDIYAFSHAFKRATGISPSEWC